jgi:DNA-binding transcriptional MerR regulator
VTSTGEHLNPSDAANRLGVSVKALRVYERRGLIDPVRTEAGWRTYGPAEMARAAEIVALRALGLSLAQVARVMDGDPHDLEPALAAHQSALEGRLRETAKAIEGVRGLRADLATGCTPAARDLARLARPAAEVSVSFELPWPWGGERFELRDTHPLTYITGPLGSGKTRFAMKLAETLPGAVFVGLDRLDDDSAAATARLETDPALKSRVDKSITWLVGDGAASSPALTALVVALETEDPSALVVDMVEQGLDRPSQEALAAHLRHRASGPKMRPLFLLTRSEAVLDLAGVGPNEAIYYCPANHSPPVCVAPYAGAPGYEAVATCLASPEVRSRTEGVIAWRPPLAIGA